MRLDDPDPPVHGVSRPEDRERILAEALAHAEAQEAQYKVIPVDPRRGSRWQAPVAALLLLAAAVLALFPPAWLGPTRPVAPPASEMERGVRAALYLQAQQIEAYRAREGRLPASLADVAGHLDGIRFVRSNNRVYQLVGHGPGESPVVYDSARPDPVFHAAAEPFLGQAGDQP